MNFTHRYSNSIYNSRVVVIGPYPPPLGGVSVHIARVMHKLHKQNNSVFHFHNEKPYRYAWLRFLPCKIISYFLYFTRFFLWILIKKPHHVFYHTMYSGPALIELVLLVCARLLLNFNIVVVEHHCRHMYTRTRWWRRIYNYFAQYVQVVFMGPLPYQSYIKNNIDVRCNTIEGAFLPPDTSQEKVIIHSYTEPLTSFIKNNRPILLMNASHIKFWHNQDVYGFDQMIEAMLELKKTFPHLGLVIMLASMNDKNYFVELQNQIKRYNLVDHVFFNVGQNELWPLLKQVDLFVRPTVCDGASISLQEALYFGTPVVASNVCARPEGTIVYQQGDVDNLVQKISMVLKEINHGAVDQQCNHMYTQQTG